MLSLQDVQAIAKERTKASNPTAYFLVRLFGEKDRRDHSFLIYAYFRWVDDIIDCPRTSYEEKKRFMERQGKLLRNLYDGLAYQGDYILEEQFAHYFVAFDREMGFALKDDILGMFSVSMHDLERNGAPTPAKEMDEFIYVESKSFINMIRFFCGETGGYDGADEYDEGIGCKLVHLLRDFIEDLDQGCVNISRDDMEKYRINLDNVNNDNFRAWVRDRVELVRERFRRGKRNLSNSRRLRYKIASYLYCAKYEDILTIIEKDNYYLRSEHKRTILEKAQFLYRLIAVLPSVLRKHYLHKRIRRLASNHGRVSLAKQAAVIQAVDNLKEEVTVIWIDREVCCYCGVCVGVCPKNIITLLDSFVRIELSKCTRCWRCVNICPVAAMEVESDA